ncbi:hypothetical protein VNO77_22350 [Canavalia gladiata]|uniref:Basic blue protein n=1 Tax=Canavalia gladiata TaxID=3824 RepID=A0AAN9QAQ1_CANGL
MAHSKTFVVEDPKDPALGWTFNLSTWPDGKNFTAGDILVFNYDPYDHNVVKLPESGYNKCKATKNFTSYQSGHDRIPLEKGWNYFICTFDYHCEEGMKIAVYAA